MRQNSFGADEEPWWKGVPQPADDTSSDEPWWKGVPQPADGGSVVTAPSSSVKTKPSFVDSYKVPLILLGVGAAIFGVVVYTSKK